jgi:hypothetical protein
MHYPLERDNMQTPRIVLAAIVASTVMAPIALAQDAAPDPADRQAYFGEQHLHTVNSPDAFSFGTRNTTDEAYRFCKGEAIRKSTTGEMVQKSTPYDWCAVTDHAEYLGMMALLLDSTSALRNTPIGKLIAQGEGEAAFKQIITSASVGVPIPYMVDPATFGKVWDEQKAWANHHNDPGTFTTLIAFEWSSQPMAENLHHNVFFRDSIGPDLPFSSFNSTRREDLWTYQEVQRGLGRENFSIPHNSNVSNSMMFAPVTTYGTEIEVGWAARSNRNTPAVEIIQTKGSSETNPTMSPTDEFAGFESGFNHLLGSGGVLSKNDNSFVRRALQDGVGFQEMIGANPFKYGIVAGADAHNAFSDNEEWNYFGVHGNTDKTPEIRMTSTGTVAGEPPIKFGTPGSTGVWADANIREDIFDAIVRKETFGTSGPLIRARMFGGWNFSESLLDDTDWVDQGYANGVHMGMDLPAMPDGASAPTFVMWALKDPESGNLDRIQMVKGWYEDGHPWEQVYDVVWSDNRVQDSVSGKVPPVGNTVDVTTATYTNNIGDNQLFAVWSDPDFDPTIHAVYYMRVIEIPTPRWSTFDAVALGVPLHPDAPATIQERAWTSPIWYTPEASLVNRQPFYPGLQRKLP